MNDGHESDWYARLWAEHEAIHDRVCLRGKECPDREYHITEAYMALALKDEVEYMRAQLRGARKASAEAGDAYMLGYSTGWNDRCDAMRRKESPSPEDYRAYETNPYVEDDE